MKKITREELLKSLGEMTAQLANAESRDSRTRATFTKLLRAYRGGWDGPSPGDTMNWMEIAFAMGELRADADFSIMEKVRSDLESEVRILRKYKEDHPEKA